MAASTDFETLSINWATDSYSAEAVAIAWTTLRPQAITCSKWAQN